jgi:sterol desaturase/sphingolipid hydroxylase (fatty acid hydroxylase superfamily)
LILWWFHKSCRDQGMPLERKKSRVRVCKAAPPLYMYRSTKVRLAPASDPMRRTAITTSLSTEVMRRLRHFGDFVTVPLAIVILLGLTGVYRLHLLLGGVAAWTLLEYLVHRIIFHRYSAGRRLHRLHHDHPNDLDAERSSLSTPLIAFPIGFLLIVTAGVEDGSAIFAGLLLGYLAFIVVHYAVHRWPIEPNSWLYSAKVRHLTHHRFDNCNYGVTTIFWDIVFRTNARIISVHVRSGESA